MSEASQPIVHNTVIEEVLKAASRIVEVRIAQFRAVVAFFLLIFNVQLQWQAAEPRDVEILYVGSAVSIVALLFSICAIKVLKRGKTKSITALSIFSIGLDATLMILPVSLYLAAPQLANIQPVHSGALINQPTVFAMYLLVIASGLRFRRIATLGIVVNSLVIVCLMSMEAMSSQLADGMDPVSALALKQHVFLLLGSALLAQLISTHTRATTEQAASAVLQATTDALTGVYNRHHLRERLKEIYLTKTASVYLMMIDADHFKMINDSDGHVVGDRVLIELSRRLQNVLRPSDLLARYGGEEFCVVLEDMDEEVALTIAERLRSAVDKEMIENRKVTVSVGISRRTEQDTITDLLRRADRALYRSKEGGRNQVQAEWPIMIGGRS